MSPLNVSRSAIIASLLWLFVSPAFAQDKHPPSPGNSGSAPGQQSASQAVSGARANPSPGGNAAVNNRSSARAGGAAVAEKPKPHDPNPHASPHASAIQAVLQKFDASRDKIVNDRKALLDRLATAQNDVERESILAELRTEKQTVQEQQRQTARDIRAELQSLRRQRSGP